MNALELLNVEIDNFLARERAIAVLIETTERNLSVFLEQDRLDAEQAIAVLRSTAQIDTNDPAIVEHDPVDEPTKETAAVVGG